MSSRARTRERRQEREQQRKRNRQIAIIGVVVAAAVILAVLLVISNLPAEATISEEAISLYEGLPQSVSEEGFPMLGSPDAPVQVAEYSSFDCPHCMTFYQSVTPALIERVRAGEISFTYVPLYGTGGIRNGEGAARAAICAGEQEQFWPFHSALFTWQNTYANQAFDGNRLEGGAANLGLDVAAWNSCLRSEETNALLVAANTAASQVEGFTGTPTITVNGQLISPTLADVTSAIDSALASAPPVEPVVSESTEEATEAAEPTPEVTEEASE